MNRPNKTETQGFKTTQSPEETAGLPTPPELRTVRVKAVNKNSWTVIDGYDEAFAEITGKRIYQADSPLDYPAVGDWVRAEFFNDNTFAVIHDILPRKSLLMRKTPGQRVEFQVIAANIDTAFLVQSLDADFNIRRLERYLVMTREGRVRPVVLLSKSDRTTPDDIERKKEEIRRVMPDVPIVAFSNVDRSGIEDVAAFLIPGEIHCLLGSSGVGKTTLLNTLIGEAVFKTQEVREQDGKGRHTTARREWVVMENNAVIVDTPGMRELGLMDAETGIEDTFPEITALTGECRFNDCTHTQEQECAVLAAVKDGTVSGDRYQSFLKLQREARYHTMSYVEKRRRDREFGKMVKSVMKHKKKKIQ